MRKLVYFALLAVLLLAACSPAAPEQPAAADQEKPLVTVYREPT
jgi:outer membrane biogenesis lipoprotein LolB